MQTLASSIAFAVTGYAADDNMSADQMPNQSKTHKTMMKHCAMQSNTMNNDKTNDQNMPSDSMSQGSMSQGKMSDQGTTPDSMGHDTMSSNSDMK